MAEGHFRAGLTLQNQGALDQAAHRYQHCIQLDPSHAQAHHMLGLLCAWRGKLPLASQLIQTGIRLRPDDAGMWINLGNVQKLMGHRTEALRSFDAALSLAPDHPDALNNRGVLLGELNRHEEAATTLAKALETSPAAVEVRCNLGKALRDAGRLADALSVFEGAVQRHPDHAGARSGLGRCLLDFKRAEEALAHLREALRISPQDADACNELGNALVLLARYREAVPWYRQALALKPGLKQALGNLGYALQEAGLPEEAIGMLDEAIAATPGDVRLHISRATVLQRLGSAAEALASLERALELDASDVAVHVNRGNVLQNLDRMNEAVQAYREALRLDAESADANWNLAIALLGLGQFEAGWQLYEYRWKIRNFHRPVIQFADRLWHPERDEGKVLVWAEQGLGDELMLSGFLPSFAQVCPRFSALVDRRLTALLARTYPQHEFLARRNPSLPEFDWHLPFGSMPSSLPAEAARQRFERPPRLVTDSARVADYRSILAGLPGLKVGLSWRSSNERIGKAKSIDLDSLEPLLNVTDVSYVNLQYGHVQSEIEEFKVRSGIEVFQVPGLDLREDIDGAAALIEACDLVITTSNSTAHLAGAIGKKSVLLAPRGPGLLWYWRNRVGAQSLWYPNMMIFDQAPDGAWDPAFEGARAILTIESQGCAGSDAG